MRSPIGRRDQCILYVPCLNWKKSESKVEGERKKTDEQGNYLCVKYLESRMYTTEMINDSAQFCKFKL